MVFEVPDLRSGLRPPCPTCGGAKRVRGTREVYYDLDTPQRTYQITETIEVLVDCLTCKGSGRQ